MTPKIVTLSGAPKTPADVLDAAADLIGGPGAWIQCAYATSGNGLPIEPWSPDATCFCVTGAIARVTGQDVLTIDRHRRNLAARAYIRLCRTLDVPEPFDWNDASGRTQTEVVQALRQAAARAREAQP